MPSARRLIQALADTLTIMQPTWVSLGFFGLVGIAIVETILSTTWEAFYFRFGLPIFVCEIPMPQTANSPPGAAALEQALLGHYKMFGPMAFENESSGALFFRERLFAGFFCISYTPVMHGRLTFDASATAVRVLGLANWSPVVFLAFIATLAAVLDPTGFYFLPFALAILASIYVVQFLRFRMVAVVAAQCWAGQARASSRGAS